MKTQIITCTAIASLTTFLGCVSPQEQAVHSAALGQSEFEASQAKERILSVLKTYKVGETKKETFFTDAGLDPTAIFPTENTTKNGWVFYRIGLQGEQDQQRVWQPGLRLTYEIGYSFGSLATLEFKDDLLTSIQIKPDIGANLFLIQAGTLFSWGGWVICFDGFIFEVRRPTESLLLRVEPGKHSMFPGPPFSSVPVVASFQAERNYFWRISKKKGFEQLPEDLGKHALIESHLIGQWAPRGTFDESWRRLHMGMTGREVSDLLCVEIERTMVIRPTDPVTVIYIHPEVDLGLMHLRFTFVKGLLRDWSRSESITWKAFKFTP